jgi:hypothetical protein
MYDQRNLGISDAPLQSTNYGKPAAREISWTNSVYASTKLSSPSFDQTVSPAFKDSLKKQWDTAAADFARAMAAEQARIKSDLDRQLNQGITIGLSLTLGPPIPVFGVSFTSGPWTIIISTNLSNMALVFPAWNGIGLPIPITLGMESPPPPTAPVNPPSAQPQLYGEQPIPQQQSKEQASSYIFTATRAGDALLSGPSSYISVSASSPSDPNGWTAYLMSLVGNTHTWTQVQATYMVGQFMRCKDAVDDLTPCSVFVSNVLEGVFNISEFDGFRDKANGIFVYLDGNPGLWEKLGNGASQAALTRAQAEANSGHAVVAVWKNPDANRPGHIALIIPGVLKQSDTWGLLVPNAAQTSVGRISGAWIGRPLSNSFGADKKEDVNIYVRH